MHRRKFIQKTGSIAGLAALGNSTFSSFAAAEGSIVSQASNKQAGKNLGIALVGLGNYAMGQLAPALLKTEQCHLAGLVTGTPEKETRYGKEYNISDQHIYNYDRYDELAQDDSVDAIYVVLPNSMHAEYSIRAAEAGKHVICEKPMAVSVDECNKMMDAAKANGVSLNIGYRLHYDPHHDALRKLIAEQKYGPAKFIQAEFSFTAGNPKQWRLNHELAGGGALMDVGVYCIQAARYCSGEEPVAVTAREYKTDPVKFASVDETVVWEMEFPSGCVASCNTSYNYRNQRLHVSYRDKNFTAELSPAFMYKRLKGRAGRKEINYDDPSQQARHMDAIARSINGGAPTTTTGAEGLKDMKIIEAIYRSIENNGQRVEV